ncbi:unnamed protein product [Callosobruchus maculatus]|uniref:Uncharacterized protein n=1 Tax=Callosobruchus maculatus TaxID=64391 RepID=A0A653CSL4_CALMS|nr:unnamed protein product [Callosobruchus maculatus]
MHISRINYPRIGSKVCEIALIARKDTHSVFPCNPDVTQPSRVWWYRRLLVYRVSARGGIYLLLFRTNRPDSAFQTVFLSISQADC